MEKSLELQANHRHVPNPRDRETVAEAAGALGEIGDVGASQALLGLLQGSQDDKIIAAASEALARLGEMAAIYEIVPRMSATRNPVLKRSLAVAVGDLLGTPGEFYRSYVREQRSRGVEMGRLLDDVRERIRALSGEGVSTQRKSRLLALVRHIERAYDRHELHPCIDQLRDLATGIAAARFGSHLETRDITPETLVWHDERFGVGAWCIDLIHTQAHQTAPTPVSDIDILLAVHFLAYGASALP